MRLTIDTTGISKALASLPDRLSKAVVRDALTRSAEPMRQTMASLAPRGPDAPHIADNIVVSLTRSDDTQEVAVAIGPAVGFRYGFYQEFGTRYHPAQPFMRPGLDAGHELSLQRLSVEFWAALTRAGVTGGAGSPGGTGSV